MYEGMKGKMVYSNEACSVHYSDRNLLRATRGLHVEFVIVLVSLTDLTTFFLDASCIKYSYISIAALIMQVSGTNQLFQNPKAYYNLLLHCTLTKRVG